MSDERLRGIVNAHCGILGTDIHAMMKLVGYDVSSPFDIIVNNFVEQLHQLFESPRSQSHGPLQDQEQFNIKSFRYYVDRTNTENVPMR